jgi:hypothetical protein
MRNGTPEACTIGILMKIPLQSTTFQLEEIKFSDSLLFILCPLLRTGQDQRSPEPESSVAENLGVTPGFNIAKA